jgi:hypothetical protein
MSSLATALSVLMAAVPEMETDGVTARKWNHVLEDADELLNELRCSRKGCGRPIAALRGIEFVCSECDTLFVDGDCQGCGMPLLTSEAVGEHSDRHDTCCGPRLS